MTHEDWFDSDGYFIGHIPRVIWRPVVWMMKYQGSGCNLEDIQQAIIDIGFCVDLDKAIAHIKATTAWSMEEIQSWGFIQLTMEIFLKACFAIAEGENFRLLKSAVY